MQLVAVCEMPSASLLAEALPSATFHDSYRVPLRRSNLPMEDLFFAVFGHHPGWIKAALLVRNAAVRPFGLATPDASSILAPERKSSYSVGDTIGPWPIFALTERELVVGRDNSHLDFRVSLLREKAKADGGEGLVVSTICKAHNRAGWLYIRVIAPFHRFGLTHILAKAVRQRRL